MFIKISKDLRKRLYQRRQKKPGGGHSRSPPGGAGIGGGGGQALVLESRDQRSSTLKNKNQCQLLDKIVLMCKIVFFHLSVVDCLDLY